jgi:hypothetical protein
MNEEEYQKAVEDATGARIAAFAAAWHVYEKALESARRAHDESICNANKEVKWQIKCKIVRLVNGMIQLKSSIKL